MQTQRFEAPVDQQPASVQETGETEEKRHRRLQEISVMPGGSGELSVELVWTELIGRRGGGEIILEEEKSVRSHTLPSPTDMYGEICTAPLQVIISTLDDADAWTGSMDTGAAEPIAVEITVSDSGTSDIQVPAVPVDHGAEDAEARTPLPSSDPRSDYGSDLSPTFDEYTESLYPDRQAVMTDFIEPRPLGYIEDRLLSPDRVVPETGADVDVSYRLSARSRQSSGRGSVVETTEYTGEDEYGVEETVTFEVLDDGGQPVTEYLDAVLQNPAEAVSGTVETREFGIDTGDGVVYEESTWIDLDGYDMDRGEFFVDGELADRNIDRYSVSDVDDVTYVTADVFEDSEAAICGTDVELEQVLPDRQRRSVLDFSSTTSYTSAAAA